VQKHGGFINKNKSKTHEGENTINEHETNTDSEHKNINKELGRRMTTNQQRLGYKRRLKKGTNQEGAGGTTQTLIR